VFEQRKTGSARFGAGYCGGFSTVGYTQGYSNPALSGLSEFANDFSTLDLHYSPWYNTIVIQTYCYFMTTE